MLEYLIYFLVVYLLYFFITIRRFDKEGNYKKKKEKKIENYEALPGEVKYFVLKYKVDLKKVNLRSVLKLIGFILGLEIVIIMVLINMFLKINIAFQIIVATIILLPVYLISLKFLGMYFKKKGWVKNV